MKNRTVLGLVCIVLALVLAFVIAPFVNKFSDSRSDVLRVKQTVAQGHRLTGDDIETVSVGNYNLPADVLTNPEEVIGKYAAVGMTKGDYLFASKLTDTADTANDVFKSLDGSQVAVSVTIPSFAGGLSGKLQNGDIISLIFVDKDGNESVIPPELQYVKVITATTAGGIDKEDIIKNEDGSFEIPSTVTVLANTQQALLLAKYEAEGSIQAALVFRGEKEKADEFLAKQDAVFAAPTQQQNAGGENNG
ncbi:MAG: pilus assembly protein CpaB [Clostridia bacterium]|nr:pilus assembly protein CpaB [Clostridia bacterium]